MTIVVAIRNDEDGMNKKIILLFVQYVARIVHRYVCTAEIVFWTDMTLER